jgi:hypothetical protein
MKQEIRQEINRLKLEAPKTAKELEKFVFKENEVDKPLDFNPEDIIKYYPGSSKGPLPEDDPETYSEWFMRNQPVEQIYGKNSSPDFRDIGVKWTFGYGKQKDQDLQMIVERKDTIKEFLEANEAYTLENYEDIPEFAIADFD